MIELDDNDDFTLMQTDKMTGVFQFESVRIQRWSRQFDFSRADVSTLNAFYHPKQTEYLPEYIVWKKDPTKIKYTHPLLKNVC
jgi:DNA polymerase III alpha subunit